MDTRYVPVDRDEAAGLLGEGLVDARNHQVFGPNDQASYLVNGLEALGYYICTVEPLETGDD